MGEQKQKKMLKKKNSRMKELLSKISNARKKKEKKKDSFERTLVIGPEDLGRPNLVHMEVEKDATRHMKMKKLLSKMGSKKSSKSDKDHLDDLRKTYPFIDEFFGEIESLPPSE